MSKELKIELPHDKTNKMACVPSNDSDQPGHLPSLIRVIAVHMKNAWVLSYPLSAQLRLWSDWVADLSLSLVQVILLVLSWGGTLMQWLTLGWLLMDTKTDIAQLNKQMASQTSMLHHAKKYGAIDTLWKQKVLSIYLLSLSGIIINFSHCLKEVHIFASLLNILNLCTSMHPLGIAETLPFLPASPC